MKNSYLVLIALMLVIISCGSDRNRNPMAFSPGELTTIAVSPERNKKLQLSEVVKRINFVPLETNAESLMGVPAKVEYDEGKYFVFDKDVSEAILIFDSTGRYIESFPKNSSG